MLYTYVQHSILPAGTYRLSRAGLAVPMYDYIIYRITAASLPTRMPDSVCSAGRGFRRVKVNHPTSQELILSVLQCR